MKRFYLKIRIILLTFAFGLASVSFCHYLFERWDEISMDLPEVQSETPLYFNLRQLSVESISLEPTLYNQNPDLSDYEFGGDFTDCHYARISEMSSCIDSLAKARDFIWNHWQEKKTAYINYQVSGIDAGVDYQIVIKADKKGN